MAATPKDIRKRVRAATKRTPKGSRLRIDIHGGYRNGWFNVNGRAMHGPAVLAQVQAVTAQLIAEFAHQLYVR